MAQINGSSSKNNYGFYAVITESLPSNYINTNKTIINYTIYIKNNNVRFNSSGWTKYVKIDGSNVFYQTNQSINSSSVGYSSALAIISGSTEITHNDNGSKSISFEACIEKSSYTAYDPGRCYLSGSIILTTIPRASTVVCTNGTIGSAVSININRASSLFTHTLKYSFGNLTGTIATNVSTNYGWVIPTEFYSQIPNSKTGDVTIFCETYQNENKIGDTKNYKFKVSVDEENCKPIADVNIETIDNNTLLLTQDSSTAIKFISNVKVTTIAESREYSTINKIEVLCGDGKNSSGSEALISAVESGDFIIKITDSRGCVTTIEKSISIIDYILMTLNANPTRINPTSGKIRFNITGNYFSDSFGARENELHLLFRAREITSSVTCDLSSDDDWIELTPEIIDKRYSYFGETDDLYNYQKRYEFEFKVYDKLTSATIIRKITEGIPSFAIFDKFVEFFGKKTFEKNGDLISLNIDYIYPIGSIYISVNKTEPGILFGGTWERIEGRFLLGAGTPKQNGHGGWGLLTDDDLKMTFTAGTSSGEYRHKLQVPEIPSDIVRSRIAKSGEFSTGIWKNYGQTADTWSAALSGQYGLNGGGQSHNNMPPYFAVYMWQRIA